MLKMILPADVEGEECFGATGAVTRIGRHSQRRVLRGLPSLAPETREAATGPQDVAIGAFGAGYVVVGWGGDPDARGSLDSVGRRFGQLYRASIFGGRRAIAAGITERCLDRAIHLLGDHVIVGIGGHDQWGYELQRRHRQVFRTQR